MKNRNALKSLTTTLSLLTLTTTIAMAQTGPLKVVDTLDFTRYAGTWYEIARFPNRFQTKCLNSVTADYALKPDGNITVLNRCNTASGSIQAEGLAKKANKEGKNSILKVRFAPSFLSFIPQVWGDYQVIALGSNYEYSVVGDPARKYLWVLSRTPVINEALYQQAVKTAADQGFDVSKLVKTPTSPAK